VYSNEGLRALIEVFQIERYMPDPAPVLVTLAMYAAHCLPGQSPWLMMVGGPSGGKTDMLKILSGLPGVHSVGSMTAAALLSGTNKKEVAKDATGGLLRQVGEVGLILVRDFTSIISMGNDPRQQVLPHSEKCTTATIHVT